VHVMAPSEPQLQGLDSHERFLAHLEDQVSHARYFGRGLALLMVQATDHAGAGGAHVSRWYPRLRRLLRPVDRVGIYGPSALLIGLPEAGPAEATTLGERIVGLREIGASALRCGLDFFGADRVVFASDCPFDPEGGPTFIRESIRAIDSLKLPERVRNRVYFDNALRMLRLKLAASAGGGKSRARRPTSGRAS